MWVTSSLKWSNDQIRNQTTVFGTCAFLSNAFLIPWLLRKMSALGFTTLANLFIFLAFVAYGGGELLRSLGGDHWPGAALLSGLDGQQVNGAHGICCYLPVAFLAPGVNGGSQLAVRAVASGLANEAGIGKGEFSAWLNNMRAITVALASFSYGSYYAWCEARGGSPFGPRPRAFPPSESSWWLVGILGGLVPQLLVWSLPKSVFDGGAAKKEERKEEPKKQQEEERKSSEESEDPEMDEALEYRANMMAIQGVKNKQ